MPDFNQNEIFDTIAPFLPQHLAKRLTPAITPDDALAVSIHLASLRYIISTYLPRYLVKLITHDPTPGQVSGGFKYGTVMFADVSGFTAMSEKLSALGKEGAEEITGIVNDYFDTMLSVSAGYGGDLLKFGGDALLLFFEGQDGALRAVATGDAMQKAMSRFARVKTSQGIFPLRMSIGMGSGSIFLANLGATENMEYAVMGRALANMAQAEDRAVAGQVMVDQATYDSAAAIATFSPAADKFWLLEALTTPYLYTPPPLQPEFLPAPPNLGADVNELLQIAARHVTVIRGLRPFLPERLLTQLILDPQRPTVPGSHRPVTVMFLNFYGIDEIIEALGPAHEEAITRILNTHFVTMSRILARYDGLVNKVDTYAIGHRIMALFGALRAHEDDPRRAVRAALEINQALETVNRETCRILAALPDVPVSFGSAPLKQRVGLNSGFVFAGNVGSAARHEYSVMGDEVNLTARLMSAAREGEVLISQSTFHHCRDEFNLKRKEPVKVKGKTAPVNNYEVLGLHKHPKRWSNLISSPVVGRAAELQVGRSAVAQALAGHGRVLVISGVSGIGKTRLAEEIACFGQQEGMTLLGGTCLSYGQTMTYHPWAEILRSYFGIQADDDAAARLEAVERGMEAAGEKAWMPIIGEVLGLEIPDNDLTRTVDAKLRRQRILDLTVKLLQLRAARQPLLVVVEDAHWADPASLDMITYVARNIARHPILLILPHRPDDGLPNWSASRHAIALPLQDLPEDACLEIVYGMLGNVTLPDSLQRLILSKSEGNPFFIEEVLRVLIDSGALQQDDTGQWQAVQDKLVVELPDTIHGMIISRIDRLLEVDRRILQVASVVGRIFSCRVIDGVYVYSDQEGATQAHLDRLSDLGLTELETLEALIYRFNHLTTREVVYESMSFEQRRDLHRRIADFLEHAFADTLGEQTNLLAYHYFEGQAWAKAVEYNMLVARHAQREFANDIAVSAYERVLIAAGKLEDETALPVERLLAHESLGEVLTLLGRYEEALQQYESARQMVAAEPYSADQARHLAELCRKTADVYEKRSEYDTAFNWLEQGLRSLADNEQVIEAARIYAGGAAVYNRQGKNDEAIAWCQKSLDVALKINQREGRQAMGHAYYLLGGIYLRRGDLPRAIQFCEQSVAVYEGINDLVGQSQAYINLANSLSDLGDWERAGQAFYKSLAIKEKIGDILYQGVITNNLANIHLYRGELAIALDLLKQSLSVWKRVGATLLQAVTLSNLAQVHLNRQNLAEAEQYLQHSQAIFTEVNSEDFLPELERRWGEFYLLTGNPDEALAHTRRSLDLAVKNEARLEEGMSARMLGRVQLARGAHQSAEEALRHSLAILNELNSEYEIARTRLDLARLLRQKDPTGAMSHWRSATQTFEKLGAAADLAEARNLFAAHQT